jgi:hypothetical protein
MWPLALQAIGPLRFKRKPVAEPDTRKFTRRAPVNWPAMPIDET